MADHPFVDPISDRPVVLVIGETNALFDGTTGVRHPGCDRLADVSPDLDAFFCSACHRNGRISGAWVVDLLAARSN